MFSATNAQRRINIIYDNFFSTLIYSRHDNGNRLHLIFFSLYKRVQSTINKKCAFCFIKKKKNHENLSNTTGIKIIQYYILADCASFRYEQFRRSFPQRLFNKKSRCKKSLKKVKKTSILYECVRVHHNVYSVSYGNAKYFTREYPFRDNYRRFFLLFNSTFSSTTLSVFFFSTTRTLPCNAAVRTD